MYWCVYTILNAGESSSSFFSGHIWSTSFPESKAFRIVISCYVHWFQLYLFVYFNNGPDYYYYYYYYSFDVHSLAFDVFFNISIMVICLLGFFFFLLFHFFHFCFFFLFLVCFFCFSRELRNNRVRLFRSSWAGPYPPSAALYNWFELYLFVYFNNNNNNNNNNQGHYALIIIIIIIIIVLTSTA